jgi:superfamily II DNA or RNA helicase
MFVDFLRKLPRQAFGNSSSWEVVGYINNEQVHGTDKQRNQLIRERRKRVANDLFNKFLSEELSDNAKKQVVAAFNREYNSTYRPDYSKVPMFSTINRDFKGKPLKLTSVQLAGVGRMTVKGVGVLAHEVGFGKTLSGILAMHEAMTRGFAEKPLIVVPNDNILKQWVETIGEVLPNATVNTLGNLGAGYDLTDFKVNDGEFTIITYEGLKAMSFSDYTYEHLASKFSYITEDLNKHQSERDIQKEIEKKKELKGKMKRGTKSSYMFEDFGFDWLTVDEVHNANHIVSKVRLDKSIASDFRSQSQRTSDLGLKTWLAAQYIQEENNGRNVLLLSATPFTNKPLEYYSILSLVGNDMLERKGFFNVDQFFATFMEADNELEIGANGRPTQKTNVRRFRNNGLFQQLLSEFIDIKGEEDNPELVRPERLNKEYKIAQNELTAEAMAAAQELLSDNDTVLQGIGHARAAAFSPYATSLLGRQPKNHKEFVKNSPKIDATIKMIEQNIKDRPDAGQIIYSEVGVEYFPLIRDYLVKESGLKPSEVRIITGATSNNERVNIQTAFNNGEVKVVIGSPAIKEGLNLQGNTTDMYILSLPWNFTQLRQIEGRGWRQGNKWENIRINYMLTNDSVDVFMLQRLQLKQGLYNEAMKSGAESLDVSDIDTAELKTALITDPTVRAEIVTVQEREKLQLEKTQIEADLSFVMRKYEAYNKLVEKLGSQKNTVKMYREWAKKGDEYWAQRIPREEAQLANIENEIEEEKQSLLKKGVNVDDIVRQTEQAQNAITAIDAKIENLKEFQEELTQKFREESEAKAKEHGDMVSTYIKERKAENKGGFYKIRPQETETKVAEEETEDDVLYRSSEDIEAEYPNWLEGTTTDSGKHSTQVEGTRKTYKKVGDWIEENMGKDVAILDASSGMGYGTADLRERGFDIEDVEPYQSAERKQSNPAT